MMQDKVVAWYSDSLSMSPHLLEVACGIPAVKELIITHLQAVSIPSPATVPSLILVDLPHGFAFQHLEYDRHQGASTIVVTHNRCPEYLEDLWDCRPAILLACDNLLGELVPAVERAACGERYRLTPGVPTRLTLCERLLLHRLARGWSTKQIAAKQSLQPKTVSNQVTLLCEKLYVPDRVAAALYYWGQGNLFD